jgi:hypothetical protein
MEKRKLFSPISVIFSWRQGRVDVPSTHDHQYYKLVY